MPQLTSVLRLPRKMTVSTSSSPVTAKSTPARRRESTTSAALEVRFSISGLYQLLLPPTLPPRPARDALAVAALPATACAGGPAAILADQVTVSPTCDAALSRFRQVSRIAEVRHQGSTASGKYCIREVLHHGSTASRKYCRQARLCTGGHTCVPGSCTQGDYFSAAAPGPMQARPPAAALF